VNYGKSNEMSKGVPHRKSVQSLMNNSILPKAH
jgi:hypothetical protein